MRDLWVGSEGVCVGCQKRAVICNFSQSGQKYSHELEVEGVEMVQLAHLLGGSCRFHPLKPSAVDSSGEIALGILSVSRWP